MTRRSVLKLIATSLGAAFLPLAVLLRVEPQPAARYDQPWDNRIEPGPDSVTREMLDVFVEEFMSAMETEIGTPGYSPVCRLGSVK